MPATVTPLPLHPPARPSAGDQAVVAAQRDLFDASVSPCVDRPARVTPTLRRAPRDASRATELADTPQVLTGESVAQQWVDHPIAAFTQWKASETRGRRGSVASHSMEQYCAMFGAFLRWAHDNELSMTTISSAQLESFLEEGIGRADADGRRAPAAPSTRQRYLQLLKAVFEQLRKAGLRQSNPAAALIEGIDARSIIKPPPRVLQPDVVARYKAWTLSRPMNTWVDVRNRALRLLFLATGSMLVEVRNLRPRDLSLDPETGLFIVQIAAWGMVPAHSVPAASFATEAIQSWLDELRTLDIDSDILFPNSPLPADIPATPMPAEACFSIVQEVMLGIGWVESRQGPQTLRNTFIAQQIRAGVPAHTIRHWCGLHTDDTISRVAQVVPIRDGAPLPS
jgi:integrase